jgi:predicted transcriptional regulator
MALQYIDMKETTHPRERIAWLTENYDLSKKNAEALILAELGFSHSGIASKLGVTDSTARKYLRKLESEIGEYVTQTLPKPVRYPTFPSDNPDEPKYAGDEINYDPEFSEREKPLNKGASIQEIDDELITIEG